MIVECLAGCLYGEDSGEFTLVDAENLRQGSPGSTEEEGVKLTVVLKDYFVTKSFAVAFLAL
jgi:hypothetical protein